MSESDNRLPGEDDPAVPSLGTLFDAPEDSPPVVAPRGPATDRGRLYRSAGAQGPLATVAMPALARPPAIDPSLPISPEAVAAEAAVAEAAAAAAAAAASVPAPSPESPAAPAAEPAVEPAEASVEAPVDAVEAVEAPVEAPVEVVAAPVEAVSPPPLEQAPAVEGAPAPAVDGAVERAVDGAVEGMPAAAIPELPDSPVAEPAVDVESAVPAEWLAPAATAAVETAAEPGGAPQNPAPPIPAPPLPTTPPPSTPTPAGIAAAAPATSESADSVAAPDSVAPIEDPAEPGLETGITWSNAALLITGVTIAFGFIEALLRHSIGTITGVALLIVTVVAALRLRPADIWAAVVMPPLAFLAALVTAGQLTVAKSGSFVSQQALNIVSGLALNAPWIIGSTAVALVIVLIRRRGFAKSADERTEAESDLTAADA